jgi:Domain of unknown function (DUF4083)
LVEGGRHHFYGMIIQKEGVIVMNLGDLLYQLVIFSLLLVGVVSFTLFIRRILINSKKDVYASDDIHKKLDRIIELLEKQNQD